MKRQRGPYIKEPANPDDVLAERHQFGYGQRVTRGEVHAAAVAHKTGARGLAAEIGVSARTVFRWIHGTEQLTYYSDAARKLRAYFERVRS